MHDEYFLTQKNIYTMIIPIHLYICSILLFTKGDK
jgi:hypothetical protein